MTPTATLAPDRRIYNPVQRDAATFLETSAESGGTRTLIDIELAAGGGNAPHRHLEFAERFKVLEGTVTVRVGDDEHVLGPGETACAPIGTLHCFANRTEEPARFQVELLPGHRGFEQALQIAYGLAQDGLVNGKGIPKRLSHLALLVDIGGTRPSGPLQLLEPAFRLIARRARGKGVETELIARYCRI
jgi:quercetin dioxygenase-like cupin family protein